MCDHHPHRSGDNSRDLIEHIGHTCRYNDHDSSNPRCCSSGNGAPASYQTGIVNRGLCAAHEVHNYRVRDAAEVDTQASCPSSRCNCLNTVQIEFSRVKKKQPNKSFTEEHLSTLTSLINQALCLEEQKIPNTRLIHQGVQFRPQTEAQSNLYNALIRLVQFRPSTQMCHLLCGSDLLRALLSDAMTAQRMIPNTCTGGIQAWQHSIAQARYQHQNRPPAGHGRPNFPATHQRDHGLSDAHGRINRVGSIHCTLPQISDNLGHRPTIVYTPHSVIRADRSNTNGCPIHTPPTTTRVKRIKDISHIHGFWV